MNLQTLARIRARGERPAGIVWCSLGHGEWHHDLRLTGDESAADLAPLHSCSVLLEHAGWTPAEIWPVVERLRAVKVGSLVITDRDTAASAWLVHPHIGTTVITPMPHGWSKTATERPTWT